VPVSVMQSGENYAKKRRAASSARDPVASRIATSARVRFARAKEGARTWACEHLNRAKAGASAPNGIPP